MESSIYFSLYSVGSLNTAECRLLFPGLCSVFNWNCPSPHGGIGLKFPIYGFAKKLIYRPLGFGLFVPMLICCVNHKQTRQHYQWEYCLRSHKWHVTSHFCLVFPLQLFSSCVHHNAIAGQCSVSV